MKLGVLFIQAMLLASLSVSAQRFSYSPPENFLVSTDGMSYENKSAAAVIQFSVQEGVAFERFQESFSEEQLVSQQLIVEARYKIPCGINKSTAFTLHLYECTFSVPSEDGKTSTVFRRLIGFTGNSQFVLMVVATFPEMAKALLNEQVIASFKNGLVLIDAERRTQP